VTTGGIVIDTFDRPVIRIGDDFCIRQRNDEQRLPVNFTVEREGRVRWTGGPRPRQHTFANAQRIADRRFCPERRA
jgi:hypothetical protein